MVNSCDSNCKTCDKDCSSKTSVFKAENNIKSNIQKVIGVVSGKGGVGKSLITSLLATHTNKMGYKTAILDADITGPSIPKAFGLEQKARTDGESIFPVLTAEGIKVISINLMLENPTDPVIWRGPVLAGAVKQFWTDVDWGDIEYMFVDLPPGTGDVPITVFQSLPLDGIVLVSTPQELVDMIVEKAVKMTQMLNIPIFGIVENMSSFKCPDCGKIHRIFGEGLNKKAVNYDIYNSCSMPINPEYARAVDSGRIEKIEDDIIMKFLTGVLEL